MTPLRARALRGPAGVHYAVAPFGRAGLVLVLARVDGDLPTAASFHATEVDRIAQLVRAAAMILGDRLDLVGAAPTDSWNASTGPQRSAVTGTTVRRTWFGNAGIGGQLDAGKEPT